MLELSSQAKWLQSHQWKNGQTLTWTAYGKVCRELAGGPVSLIHAVVMLKTLCRVEVAINSAVSWGHHTTTSPFLGLLTYHLPAATSLQFLTALLTCLATFPLVLLSFTVSSLRAETCFKHSI